MARADQPIDNWSRSVPVFGYTVVYEQNTKNSLLDCTLSLNYLEVYFFPNDVEMSNPALDPSPLFWGFRLGESLSRKVALRSKSE